MHNAFLFTQPIIPLAWSAIGLSGVTGLVHGVWVVAVSWPALSRLVGYLLERLFPDVVHVVLRSRSHIVRFNELHFAVVGTSRPKWIGNWCARWTVPCTDGRTASCRYSMAEGCRFVVVGSEFMYSPELSAKWRVPSGL